MIANFQHGLVSKAPPEIVHGLIPKEIQKPKSKGLTHPAGNVTAIDEETGYPIVRRDADHSPSVEKTVDKSPREPLGKEEPGSGREILHASNDPEKIQEAATAKHPDIKADLKAAIAGIKGAYLHGARDEKSSDRVAEKVEDEGQNPRTIPDYSGFRIAVDTREAKDAVVAAIRKSFKVVREKDEFEKGAEDTAFHAHMMQIQDAGDPVTHEVQVLPKTMADNAEASHGLYEKARTGDKIAAVTMKRKNQEAWGKFDKPVKSDDIGTSSSSKEIPPQGGVDQNTNSDTKGDRGQSPEPAAGNAPKSAPATDIAPKSDAPMRTGVTVRLNDGRIGVVKGISPKGDMSVKLSSGGRVQVQKGKAKVVDAQVKGVTVGTPGHERPSTGAIAVDLDKTLAEYETYKGPTVIGKPIPAQVDAVKKMLADGEDVWIYTARAKDPESIPAIQAWAKKHIGKELPITNIKYSEFKTFIDDRAKLPVQMQKASATR